MLEFAGWLRTIRLVVGRLMNTPCLPTQKSREPPMLPGCDRGTIFHMHILYFRFLNSGAARPTSKKEVSLSYLIFFSFFFFLGGGGEGARGNASCILAPSSAVCGTPAGFASGPISPLDCITPCPTHYAGDPGYIPLREGFDFGSTFANRSFVHSF